MLLRLIVYTLIFYFIFKIIRLVVKFLSKPAENPEEPTVKSAQQTKKFDINSDDIIEADFEDIKSNDSEKNSN